MPKSLYVHVPFCEQICHYCDFNKFYLKNQPVDEYLELCRQEMEHTISTFPSGPVSTIYVGGGTPTSLSTEQLKFLLESIKNTFPLEADPEWTVEVNPGSAEEEKLAMLQETGVNRLSIGAQTFDKDLLKTINRDHQPGDIETTVELSHKAGIHNLSVDMMFGLPNQTMEQWTDSLLEITRLPIQHISAYSLKVEEKTVFYQLLRKGKLPLPGEESEAAMYEYMQEKLQEHQFVHYEISNFAKEGYESRHNLTYWNNQEYYGAGAGAHSYTDGVRRVNHGPLPKYMKAVSENRLPYLEEHPVSIKEQMEEQMFMGLRKLEGVSLKEFHNRFGRQVTDVFEGAVQHLLNRGLLEISGDRIKLTKNGLLLGNEVFEQFLLTD
ncbi:radical SAM family heme chaperone HemW [Salipaludibacillus aurantiacus]|uniref:Heme chaperone HemW n=1 Tax=Salipaludibacillus aurantiacus TaxID=1601833 RepID=A0A1H9RG24_9BACI|nr:radical SAM family heme chaperone HemW [Salipaludibacillus aurantiacus]SER70933.1 oxygen-independent coproporphyrinogen-3 oxidase [Salipaludibacillus aurantiacus]